MASFRTAANLPFGAPDVDHDVRHEGVHLGRATLRPKIHVFLRRMLGAFVAR